MFTTEALLCLRYHARVSVTRANRLSSMTHMV